MGAGPGLPFSGSYFLRVIHFPFAHSGFASPGTWEQKLPSRPSGEEVVLGTMVWLPPSCPGLRPPFQLLRKRNLERSRSGVGEAGHSRKAVSAGVCWAQCTPWCPAHPAPPLLIWKSATFFPDGRMANLTSRALSPALSPQRTGSGSVRTPMGFSSKLALQKQAGPVSTPPP